MNERAWRGERRCVRAVCGKGDVCAAWAMRGVRAVSAGQVAADAAWHGGRAGRRGVGAGAVPCCLHRTKSEAADGSLVRYLCLIVYTLSSSFFSGLGDFWGEKSSSGVWGEAPYIMVLGRGMGRSPIKTFSLMSGLRARSPIYDHRSVPPTKFNILSLSAPAMALPSS